jgi:riboflavin synthase
MFTGIIECMGTLLSIEQEVENLIFEIESPISDELKIDQSLAHDGICLTVIQQGFGKHRVCAIRETIEKTTCGNWQAGKRLNLERCLPVNGRLDGHLVQGHVDCRAVCQQITEADGSWVFQFNFPSEFAALVIEKGSISVNGTSLTCHDIGLDSFSVSIIPYTYTHTSIQGIRVGDTVNIEFDILGKYLSRWQNVKQLTS